MPEKSGFTNKKLSEMLSLFDVCGLTGVVNISGLKDLAHALQNADRKKWEYLYSRLGYKGRDTLAAFGLIWRKDRVKLTGVMPTSSVISSDEYQKDPMCIGFAKDGKKFAVMLVSIEKRKKDQIDAAGEINMVVEAVNWSRAFWDERDLLVAGNFGISEEDELVKDMIKKTRFVKLERKAAEAGESDDEMLIANQMYVAGPMSEDRDFSFSAARVFGAIEFIYGSSTWETSKQYEKDFSYHLPLWVEMREID